MDISAMPPSLQPPSRRPYKRVSPQQWEQQKDRIHELFIGQDKTHEEVIEILKEHYCFDTGVRQLKRKTDEWGFVKNIPKGEMQKMVRKRKRRQDDLGKATSFKRRHGAGDFYDVSQERLDRFERRFVLTVAPTMSISTSTPSNILYHTPSNVCATLRSDDRGSSQATREATIESNGPVEDMFHNGIDSGIRHQVNSLSPSIWRWPSCGTEILSTARKMVFKGDYSAAREKFDLMYLVYKSWGVSRCVLVGLELCVALMRAAEFEGCPQSIAARTAQELSRLLMRERQNYIQQPDSIELRRTLTALELSAQFWCQVLVQQRALQLWEPILGSEHPKIVQLHENIAEKEGGKLVHVSDIGQQLEKYELSTNKWVNLHDFAYSPSIEGLLHLADGSPSELLKKFEALERSDIIGRQLRQGLADLRYGRSRSMLGCYYSLLGRYDDAERAFQDGTRYMKYEVCTEIRLHRIMWYAEHKTRTADWEDMRNLLTQAHMVFMENEKPSDFVITHFPHRFKLLCAAASERLPIDRLANEPQNSSVCERLPVQRETTPASIQQDPGSDGFPSQLKFPLTKGYFR